MDDLDDERERTKSESRRRSPRPDRLRSGGFRRPTGRAVLGGALVATAAAGVLLSQRAATAPPDTSYVVAVRDVPAGQAITPADLGTINGELPSDLSAVERADADELIGRTARVTLSPMDLVRRGDVYEAGRFGTESSNEVVLELPPAAALHGTLAVGDHVTVLSTDPDGSGTTTVATGVLVTSVQDGDSEAIGADGGVRVRVGLPDSSTTERVVDAAIRSEVTLVLPGPGTSRP